MWRLLMASRRGSPIRWRALLRADTTELTQLFMALQELRLSGQPARPPVRPPSLSKALRLAAREACLPSPWLRPQVLTSTPPPELRQEQPAYLLLDRRKRRQLGVPRLSVP